MMRRRRFRQLPVVLDGMLTGIVTDRDLHGTPAKAVVVADVMTQDPLFIEAGASVDEAARVLRRRKINALPVLDEGRMVGIITVSDVLEAFIELSGVTEPSYRLILAGAAGAKAIRVIRRIVEEHGGDLKWTYVEGTGKKGKIHLRLRTRRLDDLTTALEGAGFEVAAAVSAPGAMIGRPPRGGKRRP